MYDEFFEISTGLPKAGLVGHVEAEHGLAPAGRALEAPRPCHGENFLAAVGGPYLEIFNDDGIGKAAVDEFAGLENLVEPDENSAGGHVFDFRVQGPEFVDFFEGFADVFGGQRVDHVPDLLFVLEADEGVDGFGGDGGGVGFEEGEFGEFVVEALHVAADEVSPSGRRRVESMVLL